MEANTELVDGFTPAFCPYCGQKAPKKEIFCHKCGERILFSLDEFNAIEAKYCIGCGAKWESGSNACGACGEPAKVSLGHFYYTS